MADLLVFSESVMYVRSAEPISLPRPQLLSPSASPVLLSSEPSVSRELSLGEGGYKEVKSLAKSESSSSDNFSVHWSTNFLRPLTSAMTLFSSEKTSSSLVCAACRLSRSGLGMLSYTLSLLFLPEQGLLGALGSLEPLLLWLLLHPWKLPVLQLTEELSAGDRELSVSTMGKVPGLWPCGIWNIWFFCNVKSCFRFCWDGSFPSNSLLESMCSAYVPLPSQGLPGFITGLGVLPVLLFTDWLLLLQLWGEKEELFFVRLPERSEIFTQFSIFIFSSLSPSRRTGSLIMGLAFVWPLLKLQLLKCSFSIFFRRLFLFLDGDLSKSFSSPVIFKNSLGGGEQLKAESSEGTLTEEHLEELVLVSTSSKGFWELAVSLSALLLLWIEDTSCFSPWSTKTLSWLLMIFNIGLPGVEAPAPSSAGEPARLSMRDHRWLHLS